MTPEEIAALRQYVFGLVAAVLEAEEGIQVSLYRENEEPLGQTVFVKVSVYDRALSIRNRAYYQDQRAIVVEQLVLHRDPIGVGALEGRRLCHSVIAARDAVRDAARKGEL